MKININFSSIFGFDFLLFIAVQILMTIGVFFIYSSGVNSNGIVVSTEYIKQIVWVISGDILLVTISFLDYKILKSLAPWFYFLILVLLVITATFGQVVNGSRSWIGFGALGIQPSEVSKLATILFLSRYLENNRKSASCFKTFLIGFIIISIPMGLILMQPDLGTAMVFIPIFIVMMFIAGGKSRYLLFLLLTGFLTMIFSMYPFYAMYISKSGTNSVILFTDESIMTVITLSLFTIILISLLGFLFTKKRYFYVISYLLTTTGISYVFSFIAKKVLKDYQIMRLIVFLDPQVDPRGSGWNIIQSVTAVGSGGAFGKGYLQGTQSHYRYLPEQSTDFIFSIISEEIGFMGNLLIILLFSIILWRCMNIILKSRDLFGSLIASGMVGMISFHFIINIGMAIGIMPITGIPLVFLSYGGSSLWTTLIGIGILLSVYHRRYKNLN